MDLSLQDSFLYFAASLIDERLPGVMMEKQVPPEIIFDFSPNFKVYQTHKLNKALIRSLIFPDPKYCHHDT